MIAVGAKVWVEGWGGLWTVLSVANEVCGYTVGEVNASSQVLRRITGLREDQLTEVLDDGTGLRSVVRVPAGVTDEKPITVGDRVVLTPEALEAGGDPSAGAVWEVLADRGEYFRLMRFSGKGAHELSVMKYAVVRAPAAAIEEAGSPRPGEDIQTGDRVTFTLEALARHGGLDSGAVWEVHDVRNGGLVLTRYGGGALQRLNHVPPGDVVRYRGAKAAAEALLAVGAEVTLRDDNRVWQVVGHEADGRFILETGSGLERWRRSVKAALFAGISRRGPLTAVDLGQAASALAPQMKQRSWGKNDPPMKVTPLLPDLAALERENRVEPATSGPVFNVYAHPESQRYAVSINFSRADVMLLREMPSLQDAKYKADSPEARAIVRMLEELTRRREP